MLIITLFLFFTVTHSHVVNPDDENNQCLEHGSFCHPIFENQCCDEEQSCRIIERNMGSTTSLCLRKARIGETCENNLDCLDLDFAVCNKNKKCQCIKNYTSFYGFKCATPYLGNRCTQDVHCRFDNSMCIDSKCRCADGFQPRFNNECIPTTLGQSCENDDDCRDLMHMKCSYNDLDKIKKCVCREHRILKNNFECGSLLRGYCENDDRCAVNNSVCIDNMCQCNNNYILTASDRCEPTSLGKSCEFDFECEEKVLYSTCSEQNICICKNHYVKVDNSKCIPLLDEFCFYNEPCAVNNSVCINNTCQCNTNYTAASKYHCILQN